MIPRFLHKLDKQKWLGLFIFTLLLGGLMGWRFHEIITNLGNDLVLEIWGDGLKTYTNTIYHIDQSASYDWFDGMNYPYGEHLVPATELPGIAMGLRALKPLIPNISDYVVPVIHAELLLSFLLCGIVLFLFFKKLKLPFWYSASVAIGLTFLNALFPRMQMHFGLAQPFIIPLVLYLLFCFEEQKSYKYSVLLGVSVFLTSFLHFYFFGISLFLISFYMLFSFLRKSFLDKKLDFKYAFSLFPHYFLMVGVTFLFYYFWMMKNDPVLDRSPNPYGFLVYTTNLPGLFMWKGNPLWNLLTDRHNFIESNAYVGMVAGLFLPILFLSFLYYRGKKSLLSLVPEKAAFFTASFWTALVLMVLSMGWPFVFERFEFLVDYAGPLKQFRSLGRFAWVSFFVFNILAFYFLYFYVKKRPNRLRIALMVAALGILAFEAVQFTNSKEITVKSVPHWTSDVQFSDIDSLDFSKYQATIPVPYFSIGSNSFDSHAEGINIQWGAFMGMETGVPTTGAMLTRMSFSQTFNQWQMLLKPYRSPIIFDDFKNEKPLLIHWYFNPNKSYEKRYGHLLEGAKKVFEVSNAALFETDLADFDARITKEKNAIRSILKADTLYRINNLYSTDSVKNFKHIRFEDTPSDKTYLSEGALAFPRNKNTVLFNDSLPHAAVGEWQELLMWLYVNEDKFPGTNIRFEEINPAGDVLQSHTTMIWPNFLTLDPNGWGLVNYAFRPTAKHSRFRFTIFGPERDTRMQYVDEILIKPTKTHLYQEKEKHWWRDGYWFEKY